MKLGTVRVRVGLSYDPLRLSPGFGDLYTANCAGMFLKQKYCHAPPHTNKTPNQKTKQTQTNPKNYPVCFCGTRNKGPGDSSPPHSNLFFSALSSLIVLHSRPLSFDLHSWLMSCAHGVRATARWSTRILLPPLPLPPSPP